MTTVTLARHAMATRFELVLHGENAVALRAAGEEALDEIERLEAQLSLFRPESEIAQLNARAARERVLVSPALFALLEHARRLYEESGGAFDITIGPLVRCWGFLEGSGHLPKPQDLDIARSTVGMDLLELNRGDFTVRFKRPGVMVDLGAIGKGYAIERASELLREAGVESGLLHGGTSTLYALGRPPGNDTWQVAIENPQAGLAGGVARAAAGQKLAIRAAGEPQTALPLTTISLRDESLSVSAVWGKCFEAEERLLGHVLDPRTGRPAMGAVLAAVVLPSATETDALSTALLTLGLEGHDRIARLRPGIRTLVVAKCGEEFQAQAHGFTAGTIGRQKPV